MNPNEVIKKLKDYLHCPDCIYALGNKSDFFISCLDEIEMDIKDMEKDLKVVRKADSIMVLLKHLLACINENPVGKEFSDFIDAFCVLIYNYNENVCKSSDINLLMTTIVRFVSLRLTTIELIQSVKNLTCRLNNINNFNFQPVELSKHFLASLDLKSQ